MAAVKAHSELISGVEHFDKAKMKHTETTEKNPLPEMEGLLLSFFSLTLILFGTAFLAHIGGIC